MAEFQILIVAVSLTSQGILRINFLESYHCILDLANGTLSTGGKTVSLDSLHGTTQAAVQADVTVEKTFVIGAECEMEMMGNVSNICDGTWLLEDHLSKKSQVLIARAVVTPQQERILIRVLNLKAEPLTV